MTASSQYRAGDGSIRVCVLYCTAISSSAQGYTQWLGEQLSGPAARGGGCYKYDSKHDRGTADNSFKPLLK
jgi:hypothetical protein